MLSFLLMWMVTSAWFCMERAKMLRQRRTRSSGGTRLSGRDRSLRRMAASRAGRKAEPPRAPFLNLIARTFSVAAKRRSSRLRRPSSMASISRRISSSSTSDPAGPLMFFNLYRTRQALLAPLQQDWTFILGAVTKAKTSRHFPGSGQKGRATAPAGAAASAFSPVCPTKRHRPASPPQR